MNAVVWLKLGRVSNLPTVWSNALAGSVLAGGKPDASSSLTLAGVFSLFYVGGMYLNDAFDRNVDARERPERPIPSGQVAASTVFALGFGMLAIGLGLTVWLARSLGAAHTLGALLAGTTLAGLIVLYDAFHKQNPLSPLVMGLCRVMVYVTAAYAMTGDAPLSVWSGAGLLLAHLIGLTYAAKQENLARLGSSWPLAFLALPTLYAVSFALQTPVVWVPLILYAAWTVHALRCLLPGARRSIPAAVVRLIAGIALLDAVLLAAFGALELSAVAVLLCAITRLAQRYVPGT